MRHRFIYRFLEMVPGTLVWATFVAAILLSIGKPIWAMIFIIIYDSYWLVRLLYLEIFLLVGFRRFRKALRIDWEREMLTCVGWEDIYHVIFFPTYLESYEVLSTSLEAIKKCTYPNKKERFIVVLAGEESDKDHFLEIAKKCESEFGGDVFAFLSTVHPKGLPGEIPGKGSNLFHAGHKVKEFIDSKHIPYEQVIVSSFDADTCVHPHYFTHLTKTFLLHPNRQRSSYQPITLFNNNVWDAPSFARVVSFSTTFWLMTEQIRPERLFTFSSHSMPFKALVDVGFWQNDIVTEDSRICLQCMQHYDGDYEVTPLYVPVSMDVVLGKSLWETIKSQYIQQRRWAYGVENLPWMIWNFGANKKMSLFKKLRYIWNQLEGEYSWATAPFIIVILGRLPLLFVGGANASETLALNTPHILQILMNISLVGILLSATIGTLLLPKRPSHVSRWRLLLMVFQWPLLIITFVAFGSIPATESQTRLMFGKYLGFDVTKKFRKLRTGQPK